MVFLVSFVATLVIVILLKKLLQKVPIVFYAIALAVVAFYIYAYFNGANPLLWRYLLVAVQRCTIALALLTIVMFIGVLPDPSGARNYLAPIRRQLSILGGIFALGHITVYTSAYVARFTAGFFAMDINMAAALIIAIILTVLLAVLFVTSISQIHKRMRPEFWKRLQIMAYPFYLLIYLHVVAIMLPSLLAGSRDIVLNIIIYTVLFAAYSILRLYRYKRSKTNKLIEPKQSEE